MSTPPPPPTDDAPLPPGSSAATPTPEFQAQGTQSSNRSKGKKIGIIVGTVVIVGGLIFAGFMYGPALWDKLFNSVPSTPDGTVKYVLNGIADNEPEVLWKILPASHQKMFNDYFKESLAKVDPEVHKAFFGVLQKATGLLKSKKDMILSGIPSEGSGGTRGPEEIANYYDDVVGALEIVVNSKLSDTAWIKDPDLGELIKEDGGKLMSLPIVDKLLDMGLPQQNDFGPKSAAALRTALREVEVKVVNKTETTATLKLAHKTLVTAAPESPEFKLVKVEDRWLPEAMAKPEEMKAGIDMLMTLTGLDQLTKNGMNVRQKTVTLRFLTALDGVLTAMDKANSGEELMASAMTGGLALTPLLEQMMAAFPNLGGPGGGPGGFPGGGPGGFPGGGPGGFPGGGPGGFPGGGPGGFPGGNPGAGTQPTPLPGTGGTGLPGLTPQPNVPVGRTVNWNINAGSKMRIDVIYLNKPATTVEKTFGEPDAKEGAYWVYNRLKVRNIARGGTFSTVLFRVEDGKVVEIKAR